MKHARPDYNRFQDPENKIPKDEPVFLVRGQDLSGPETVRCWANLNDENGGQQKLSAMARQQALEMEKWQKDHKGKPADLPKETETKS